MNLLFNFFEGSNVNEEIINGQAREGIPGSMGKMWGNAAEFSRGRGLWKPRETFHMVLWKPLYTCG